MVHRGRLAPVKLNRRGATMKDKTKKDRFLYTPERVDHWVTDMADVLSKSGLHWHSMAYFMERSELQAVMSGDRGLMRLCTALKGPFRRLADEADERSRERDRQGDLLDCNASTCEHPRVTETTTIDYDACERVWANMKEPGKLLRDFPDPFPDHMVIKDSFVSASLPITLAFSGVTRLGRRDDAKPPG